MSYDRLSRVIDWSVDTYDTIGVLCKGIRSDINDVLVAAGVRKPDPLIPLRAEVSLIIAGIHSTHNKGRLVPPEVIEINTVLTTAEKMVVEFLSKKEIQNLKKALLLWGRDLREVKNSDYDDYGFKIDDEKIVTFHKTTGHLKEFKF